MIKHVPVKMKTTRIKQAVALSAILALSGCASWSERDRNTAIGAGAGAVGGAILTQGSTLGTLAGAAAGGIIGNQVGKK